jgi:hypothetical protein
MGLSVNLSFVGGPLSVVGRKIRAAVQRHLLGGLAARDQRRIKHSDTGTRETQRLRAAKEEHIG